MPEPLDPSHIAGREALEILRLMIVDENVTAAARVAAAKALLDRFTPKEDAELKRREAEERAAAIAEARCLLAELAAREPACAGEPAALDQNRAAGADHAALDATE
jgi:hypothetical protein